jgi:DNA repair protein RadD
MLRPYQQECVDAMVWSVGRPGNSIVVAATGAGKTHVIAAFAQKMDIPLLILCMTKELVEQDQEKLARVVNPDEIGIFSASLNSKIVKKYTIGTIGSAYKHPKLFAHYKVVIIDECHNVPIKNLTSMYMGFFKAIGSPKILGLTGMPVRLDTSYEDDGFGGWRAYTTTKLINRMGRERFWDRIIYNIDNDTLTRQGYLCPLRYIDRTIINHADIPMNVSMSDFDLEAYEKKISGEETKLITAVFLGESIGRSVLVFCSSVVQAEKLASYIDGAEVVTAKTKKKERTRIIQGFRDETIKTVFNVGVLTTGFDHPALDVIVVCRPTRSIGLYYQMVGRGVRTSPGKTKCTVIDMTGTVKAIGPISSIKLVKRNNWELESSTCPNWHGRVLYTRNIERV